MAMETITGENVTIRQHKPEDVKFLLDMSDEIEWDVSTYDYNAHSRMDPKYLFVAADSVDEPVGFCGGSIQAPDVIYFGNFIVRKDLRGKGIGRALYKAFLEKAGDKNMVLDGASAMEDWYLTHGFPFKSYRVGYYQVTVTADMKKSVEQKYQLVELSEDMWPALLEYDRQIYPNFDRTKILRAWFTGDEVRVVVALDAGKVVGYGSIHKKPSPTTGYSIRYIFGDNDAVAETISHALLSNLPEGAFVLFCHVDDKPLPTYLQHSEYKGETGRRMYSKYEIEVNTGKMWLATAHSV